MKKKILIVDDSELFRIGLKSILTKHQEAIIREASCSSELVSIMETEQWIPDLVFMDVRLKRAGSLSGLELSGYLKEKHPHVRIIIITACEEKNVLKEAMQTGVEGFLPKESIAHEIEECLNMVMDGENYLGKTIPFKHIQHAFHDKNRLYDLLTPTEKKVFILLAKGFINKAVADTLCVSVHTIETHKSNIRQKLGIKSDVEFLSISIKEEIPEVLDFMGISV